MRDERMRLMTLAEGPARLSPLSTVQAVLRPTRRTVAYLATASNPAAVNAARISAIFETWRAFARRFLLLCTAPHSPKYGTGIICSFNFGLVNHC
jgi:hypothetical protein